MGMLLHRHYVEMEVKKAEKPVEPKKEAATVKKPGRPKKQ